MLETYRDALTKPTLAGGPQMAHSDICSVNECGNHSVGRGYCSKHYKRWQKFGDVTKTPTIATISFIETKLLLNKTKECVIWPFQRKKDGYAKIYINGKQLSTSRVICEKIHGKPPTLQHQAAHSCGNGHLGCVNPDHLSWKTPYDNTQDKYIHGTMYTPRCYRKLNPEMVKAIRKIEGFSQSQLASLFDVKRETIRDVLKRKIWAWVD
jgi:hypothetical protein